jgi:hypothetical protein
MLLALITKKNRVSANPKNHTKTIGLAQTLRTILKYQIGASPENKTKNIGLAETLRNTLKYKVSSNLKNHDNHSLIYFHFFEFTLYVGHYF